MGRRVLDCAYGIFAPLEFFGPAHDDILGDMDIAKGGPDFKLFGSFGAFHRHDDKQVHIAIRARLPASIRAKKYDLVRVKLRHNPPDHLMNLFLRR